MKKIFFLTFSLLVTAFAYQGCKPVDNTKAWAQADSIATARLMMSADSMKMSCMTDVMNAAKMRSDSMMMAMQSHGLSKGTKPKPPAPPPTKENKVQGTKGQTGGENKTTGVKGDSTKKTQNKVIGVKGQQPPK
ncbi:MAG TPA: hypothetical protein VE978_01590 [Chitinophagales bacterium]|nr:hypothetical protein [Chitinophagales bacterium]